MKNNNGFYWFSVGFCCAILSAMIISCSITPLEANMSQECGLQEWNPCYVKVIQ